MRVFLQYNEDGNYQGEVAGDTPPEHPRQIEIDATKFLSANTDIDYTKLSFESARTALEPYK